MIVVTLVLNRDLISSHRKIVDRIDTDKDGFVSLAELHYWIKHRQSRYIEENVNKHYSDYDTNKDGKIAWEEYKNTTYGYYLGNSVGGERDWPPSLLPYSFASLFPCLPLLYLFLYFHRLCDLAVFSVLPTCQPIQTLKQQ